MSGHRREPPTVQEHYELVHVSSSSEWFDYHSIRKSVLFEKRGRGHSYDANHPDEEKQGNVPFLLKKNGVPVATVRLDLGGDGTASVRLVAVHLEYQRNGHGRVLATLLEEAARARQVDRLIVNAAPDATEYYRKMGFEMIDSSLPNPLMAKSLQLCDTR